VVIATRNRCGELLRTLDHLHRLPERPSLIVIDNGSTDATADRVAADFPAVTLLALEENRGAGARTVGVVQASSDVVAFCDDDSWWAPGSLALAHRLFKRHPALGLIAGRILVGVDERLDPISLQMARSPLSRDRDLPGVPILGFAACGAIVRRRAFLEAGGFDGRTIGGEEALLAIDMAGQGWDLAYVEDVVAHHHPSTARDIRARECATIVADLQTAWLRRPLRHAVIKTLAHARDVRHAPTRVALFKLLRQSLSIAARRRLAHPAVETRLRAIERAPRLDVDHTPAVVPLPAPRAMTDEEVRERVERAADRDPTSVTGTCG
jgi:glycosyltransferase involved in cell wall biosynthesis